MNPINLETLTDDVLAMILRSSENCTVWFRKVLQDAMLPLWTSHPFEKLLAAEAAAAKLYNDRDYVRDIVDYYATSSDKSTPFLARTVVAHATFDALNTIIHKRNTAREIVKAATQKTTASKPGAKT